MQVACVGSLLGSGIKGGIYPSARIALLGIPLALKSEYILDYR